jgi:hypothetical protein
VSDITIQIDTNGGKEEKVTLPADMKIGDLIPEIVAALKLPAVDSNGKVPDWRLSDKKSGLSLDPDRTLQENSVQSGDELSLSIPPKPSPDLQFRLQIEGRGAEEVRLPRDFKTQAVIDQFRDPTAPASEWRLTDKNTGRELDPAKSLTENGVQNGYELLLKEINEKVDPPIPIVPAPAPPGPWPNPQPPVGIVAQVIRWTLFVFVISFISLAFFRTLGSRFVFLLIFAIAVSVVVVVVSTARRKSRGPQNSGLAPADDATGGRLIPIETNKPAFQPPGSEKPCPSCQGMGFKLCVMCQGTGKQHGPPCPFCGGSGWRSELKTVPKPGGGFSTQMARVPCTCGGFRHDRTCPTCGGRGRTTCLTCLGTGRTK